MTDEEVIKRRLLIDGDGTGDDRRLNVLQKQIIKWCNTTETNEECKVTLCRMLAQLSHLECTVRKSRQVAAMSGIELENYENLSKKIKLDIDVEKKNIESTKKALQEAKTVRKNKMEYDILGKVINEQPDRKETGKKLEQLKNELKALHESCSQLDRKMASRRNQFNILVVILHQLQQILDEDEGNHATHSDDNDDDEEEVITIDDSQKDMQIDS